MLPFIVAADVVQGRERLAAIRGPAVETESRWLERATARVPQVVFVAQPETVNVAPDRKFLGWPEHYLAEEVRIVHGVEERKARVDAGRGENGEEGPVRAVSGVSIAAGIIVTDTKPWMYAAGKCWLPASFECARAGALGQLSPTAVLKGAPTE